MVAFLENKYQIFTGVNEILTNAACFGAILPKAGHFIAKIFISNTIVFGVFATCKRKLQGLKYKSFCCQLPLPLPPFHCIATCLKYNAIPSVTL